LPSISVCYQHRRFYGQAVDQSLYAILRFLSR
jgi:hypothetical protein